MGFCAIRKQIELVQQIALGGLVQFVNSFNLFPNCTEPHLIFLYNYIELPKIRLNVLKLHEEF